MPLVAESFPVLACALLVLSLGFAAWLQAAGETRLAMGQALLLGLGAWAKREGLDALALGALLMGCLVLCLACARLELRRPSAPGAFAPE